MRFKEILHKLAHFLPLILLVVAIAVVHHEIKIHNFHDISMEVRNTPLILIGLAIALTAVNYLVLAGYDALALRYTGHGGIGLPKILLTSLISYAISNNTGHAWAAGGSIRYRFYTAWGVPGWDILRISLFLGATYLVGVMTMGFLVTLTLPADIRAHIQNPQMVQWMMIVCGGFLAAYWGAILFRRKPLSLKGVEFQLPSVKAGLLQTIIACFDLVLAGLILWVFLDGKVSFGFDVFLIVFILAQVAGLVSQVPGGIGVFESTFLFLMGGAITEGEHLLVVGALVLYRVVYFFLPLAIAGAGLLAYEIWSRRHAISDSGRVIVKIFSGIMPQIFAFLLVITGAVLLVSGSTPSVPDAMHWIHGFIPLPIVEVSHLLGSLIGLLLLFLARGIYLRLDAAWYGSLILLAVGAVVSLLKGFDWREATAMAFMMLLLLPARGYFRRKSSLMNMPLSWAWGAMVFVVLAGSIWIGFFAFRHVAYADDLWWKFSWNDDAPRFMRATLLMAVVITGYMLVRLMTVVRPHEMNLPSAAELDEAAKIVRAGNETQAFLALMGDKKLFWSDDRRAFVMFADTVRYWIIMGNPVGDPACFDVMLWKFREEADRHGARIVVYEAGEKHLPMLLDLGLVLLKTGEEAKVLLSGFSLDGGHREGLRKVRNKYQRNNFTFTVLEHDEVVAVLPTLRQISDRWLVKKNTREKRFSLGFFDDKYLARTRVAVVKDANGTIMAFANLWEVGERKEMSIDLMRYDPQVAPHGIMDFLFAELLLWGKAEGYEWFSMGMAPLSGLERHALAPLWHKIGTAIYDLGEEFYNFEGLHDYKAKFDPVWSPRYLAAPAGLSAPIILMTVVKLVAGGWRGVFLK